MQALIKLIFTVAVLVVLSACASNKEDLIPSNGPSMEEIYTSGLNGNSGKPPSGKKVDRRYMSAPNVDSLPEVHLALNDEFPEFPNPTLYLYVNKHVTSGGVPVIGYTTKFKMFSRVHYALPGEY